jgi:hypothetical protein
LFDFERAPEQGFAPFVLILNRLPNKVLHHLFDCERAPEHGFASFVDFEWAPEHGFASFLLILNGLRTELQQGFVLLTTRTLGLSNVWNFNTRWTSVTHFAMIWTRS